MSTNALIAAFTLVEVGKPGATELVEKIESTYVHWDGYPEHVGRQLIEHYNSESFAREICSLGYASSLEDSYAETKANAVNKVPTDVFDTVEEFSEYASEYTCAEYIYLWQDGRWYFRAMKGDFVGWVAVDRVAASAPPC